ncbi:hypothetical protein GQ44DRAFT_763740 [Phaeosphaeriaceae sp. PMI808]|nr:hypothetical protein GQ44DRAFT_763740 [Phaeosphaeriaceae sp. PMI808]
MFAIDGLSIGTVAGIIAAGVFVGTFSGLPESRSVVGRTLHSSHWPQILNTDSAASHGVKGSVRLAAVGQLLFLLLVTVASVVTPLGLYEAIIPLEGLKEEVFGYARGKSAVDIGNDFGFSRTCWIYRPKACPWSETIINESFSNTTYTADLPDGYDVRIPQNITAIYSAGLARLPKTVSGVFDIQWRTYKKVLKTKLQKEGQSYLVGDYRQLSQMVLNNAWEAIAGLIVNMKTGGIGFRNHTTPVPLPYGGIWSEDLLFIEPETKCVDLNITLDFKIPYSNDESAAVVNLTITDHGGFSNFNKDIPSCNVSSLRTHDYNKTWASPNLSDRAYLAAWLTNVYAMFYMNITNPKNKDYPQRFSYVNSKVGQQFAINQDKTFGLFRARYDQMVIGSYGSFLNMPEIKLNGTLSNSSYPNPFKMNTKNFTDIAAACSNSNGKGYANISNVAISCGMIYGAARRKDDSASLLFDPGTEWTIPLYSCASASKASIQSVSFRYNGTDGLSSLNILDIKPKTYATEEEKPLWAVENLKMRLEDVNPIWGMTLPEHENHPNISTARQESLYLPGLSPTLYSAPTQSKQSLAGVDFYSIIMGFTYATNAADAGNSYGVPDYTGRTNLALYNKWQELSRNATTATKIIDLIWTDISANAVVGTKGQLPVEPLQGLAKRNEPQTTVKVPITVYARRVRFHVLYGIPAFLALTLWALYLVVALGFVVSGKSTFTTMRRFLDQTSPGRIFTAFLYTNDCPPGASRVNWLRLVGTKRVHLGGALPRALDCTSGHPLAAGCNTPDVAPGSGNSIVYGKMDDSNISLHSMQSPQPYSPVNGGGEAQSYFNPGLGNQSNALLLPPSPATPNPQNTGYQMYHSGHMDPIHAK